MFAILLMARGGSRRGVELMPWPDGLEYAAQAVNIDHGAGAVLHFGGYSYPSRYPEGYPLILAAAFPLVGHEVSRLFLATMLMGAVAIAGMYLLAFRLFGRASATAAALVLCLSPVFLTYSTLVLSDVPTLAVTILAALALAIASAREDEGVSARALAVWLIFGLLAGFTVMIRPTNGTMLAGLALGLLLVPPRRGLLSAFVPLIAFGAGFVVPIGIQAASNVAHLGSMFASGYGWWVPELYGASGRTFSSAYLFGATLPRNPHGNLPVYVTSILGLDGMLGDRGDLRFFMYPFAAAAFGAIGIWFAVRARASRTARRVVLFGLGYLGALFALYAVYVFTDVAFILPGAFVIFLCAGYGIIASNRWMRAAFGSSRRSAASTAGVVGIVLLDVLLVVSLLTEAGSRFAANPAESEMVPALETLDHSVPADATIVTNISLQFMELYLPDKSRRFIGLNALDPGEHFTDYHLRRLYEKQAAGWNGAAPPILFANDKLSQPALDSLTSQANASAPLLLVLAAPESAAYADTLKHELDALQQSFKIEPVGESRAIAIYQLTPLNPPH